MPELTALASDIANHRAFVFGHSPEYLRELWRKSRKMLKDERWAAQAALMIRAIELEWESR